MPRSLEVDRHVLGLLSLAIRRAQRPVKIPDRSEGQFAAAGFVHVAAESQGIDIKGQDIEQVMINCRVDIDIFCVASFGI